MTETDRAVEAHIRSRLLTAYPAFSFVGEETYKPGTPIVSSTSGSSVPPAAFVVDPIDGTTNYVHGFPWACVSLALVVGPTAQPTVGVVFNPFLGLEYSGIKGRGSFVRQTLPYARTGGPSYDPSQGTKRRLPLCQPAPPLDSLSQALVNVEWGSERQGPNFDAKLATLRRLGASPDHRGPDGRGGRMVHSMRSLGSAALNICTVAAGQTDVYWEGGCWAWDVAAAWVILTEAGGRMVGGNPGEWETTIDSRIYLAVRQIGNGDTEKQEEIVRQFWDCMDGARLVYKH